MTTNHKTVFFFDSINTKICGSVFSGLAIFVYLLLYCGVLGCDNTIQLSEIGHRNGTFLQNMGLKPGAYFTDMRVLELCAAIEQDDLPAIRELYRDGVNINTVGKQGVTPLFWAFPDNKIDRFRLLLELGANPNIQLQSNLGLPQAFNTGDSVLSLSAKSQFPEHFIEVLKFGGDLKQRNGDGNCVIHEIISAGVPNARERIKLALDHGADINALDKFGSTPLMGSLSTFAQYDLALWLLQQGANPQIYKGDGLMNAIHQAIGEQRSIERGGTIVSAEQI